MTTLIVLFLLLAPTTAWGQAGWYYIPSLRLTEEYDDNIFGSSESRRADYITRLTSGLRVGFRSVPVTLLATSSADVEFFAKNSDLNGLNRGEIGVEGEWLPTQPLRLRLNALYTNTQNPAELQPSLGLELGRQESTQISITPGILYRINRRTTVDATYSFLQTDSLGLTTTTHEPRVRVNYDLTHLDVVTATYAFRSITDSGSADSTTTSSTTSGGGIFENNTTSGVDGDTTSQSHIVLLGWSRRLTRLTSFTLEAGPRFSDNGTVDAEATAGLTHRVYRLMDVSVGYSRTSTSIIGQSGTSNSQSVFGQVALQPMRSLRLVFGVTASQVTSGQSSSGQGLGTGQGQGSSLGDTLSQDVNIGATYRFNRWLSGFARYRFGHSSTEGSTSNDIFRNVGSIGLEVRYSTRIDD